MSKLTLVALDLDSVIVNLSEAIYSRLSLPFNSCRDLVSDERIYEIAGGRAKFWEWFGTHKFFAELRPYPWAHDLVNMVDKNCPDWIFLSKSTSNDGVCSGKSQWVRDNFPQFADRLWLVRGCKSRAAGPGKILIDDKLEQNILPWISAGGRGFFWDELHPSETDEAARRLNKLKLILTDNAK